MGCENSQNFDQLAVLVLNSFLNRAMEFYWADILMLYHVHYHVQHYHGLIRCCCYCFVIRPRPTVSLLSYLASTPDSVLLANQKYLARIPISLILMTKRAVVLSYPPIQYFALPTRNYQKNKYDMLVIFH